MPVAGVAEAAVRPGSENLVAGWLYAVAGLTAGTVAVGGLTRLTESGLSITNWEPFRGAKYPSTAEEWEAEFSTYRATPEYTQLRDPESFGLDESVQERSSAKCFGV